MWTEEYINAKDTSIKKVKITKLKEEELNLITKYVEYTRHFQEINQLFEIFITNTAILFHFYLLNSNDTIKRNNFLNDKYNDNITINALIINYISSAKTFVESIEVFLNNNSNENNIKQFKESLCKIYDENFSYRLLIRLRDFAQHGHLPVNSSPYNKQYAFDLRIITNTKNFKHNSNIKQELINISEKIQKEYNGDPKIAFTYSIIEFDKCIYEIYLHFINTIIKEFQILEENFRNMISNNPKIIYKSFNKLNGLILYRVKEDTFLHALNPKEMPLQLIYSIKLDLEKKVKLKTNMIKDEFQRFFYS